MTTPTPDNQPMSEPVSDRLGAAGFPPPRIWWTAAILGWIVTGLVVAVMQRTPASTHPSCGVGGQGVAVCPVSLARFWPTVLTVVLIAAVVATVLACYSHIHQQLTRTHRHHPLDPGFIRNYPFTVLDDTGWSLAHVSSSHIRRRRVGPVHTVTFDHPDGHHAIFDISSDGRMSNHATYTLAGPGDTAALFFVYTAGAAAAVTAAGPSRSVDELAALPGVRRMR